MNIVINKHHPSYPSHHPCALSMLSVTWVIRGRTGAVGFLSLILMNKLQSVTGQQMCFQPVWSAESKHSAPTEWPNQVWEPRLWTVRLQSCGTVMWQEFLCYGLLCVKYIRNNKHALHPKYSMSPHTVAFSNTITFSVTVHISSVVSCTQHPEWTWRGGLYQGAWVDQWMDASVGIVPMWILLPLNT